MSRFVYQISKQITNENYFDFLSQLQECQNLIEENRRLATTNGTHTSINHDDLSLSNASTVEEVVLQTQVETLQWQLNQVSMFNICQWKLVAHRCTFEHQTPPSPVAKQNIFMKPLRTYHIYVDFEDNSELYDCLQTGYAYHQHIFPASRFLLWWRMWWRSLPTCPQQNGRLRASSAHAERVSLWTIKFNNMFESI